MNNGMWNVIFRLPKYDDIGWDKVEIKKSCEVELEMEYDKLFLLISSNDIKFISNKIHEEDKNSFYDGKADEFNKFKNYEIKSKTIDIDNNEAIIELTYLFL